jgi:twinkle protein
MWIEKETEPILLNRDNITSDRLTICEGEYDAMALYQYGIDAVSVPMGANNLGWVETEWDYIETFPVIYLCMDQDAAGQQAARSIASRIGEWRCRLVELPKKDANECLKAGISAQEIHRYFNEAADMKPETLVTPDYFRAKVHELFQRGAALMGTPTPWNKLTAILKGWRGGELTVWSGKNGSGKSTILNQVFLDLINHDIRSCIYSGEMPPERYLRWAIIQIHGNDAPAPHMIEGSIDLLSYYIQILNITAIIEPDKLLSDFEYAARRYNVKHFIIDSLMKIYFQAVDEYRQQQEFVSRLCAFAQKFDAHVHLVAHPRKTAADEDEPGKVDIKGSSHITDLAHNVIVLNRATPKIKEKACENNKVCADLKLHVKKNREFGIEGFVNMAFNEHTKRFSD